MKLTPQWKVDCQKWHGRVLTGNYRHWCPDWDYLPVDDTCIEFECCTCKKEPIDNAQDTDTPSP